MDVVVCDEAIAGLVAAYELADHGVDVTLCERGSLGSENTARVAGDIRSQFSTQVNIELSLASKQVWDTFEERFGVDIGLRKNGDLFSHGPTRPPSASERISADNRRWVPQTSC